ncbi:MAG: SH3 domain-containing protein [Mesorhizobium sp.]|nr:SH3 domain-containing protein [Mesorhizobium sp.]MBN9243637.1 SH3 domain-containing protein [Mesorhizobium sp.]MBN9270519.1 SH3 domain-containing protein [Mesorhizobium sp.]
MKGLFGFGSPKKQRYSIQFGYDVRPSFWQELKANSHLVIAAVGTVALLGIAGTALWLAMPSGERPAFAEVRPQADGADGVKPQATEVAGAASVVSSKVAPKADAVAPQAVAEADVSALGQSDPRWQGQSKPAPVDVKAIDAKAVAVDTAAKPDGDAAKSAFAEEDGAAMDAGADDGSADVAAKAPPAEEPPAHAQPDPKAATAAIPGAKPETATEQAGAAANGHILRGVTMRSGPKKGAAAIGTIPAKTAVQVISCKSWCEVVYKGKHGFIYKSFVDRDG